MPKLDDYRSALLAALPDTADAELGRVLDSGGEDFVKFVIDHGLGPLWHERTARPEFYASRMAAEALYVAQEHALSKIDSWLEHADITYAVIKGAATRLGAYDNPAVRACHDIDLLVAPRERATAAAELVREGYQPAPDSRNISHELVLSRGRIDIDLHWDLLREGRLRTDVVSGMLARRLRHRAIWTLDPDDTLFVLLVHPSFAKHLAGWTMGLHRVADVLAWTEAGDFEWPTVRARLNENGVKTAAWATLYWVAQLTAPHTPQRIADMAADLAPGRPRQAWIARRLEQDVSIRAAENDWFRLLGFSPFLHDTPRDALRALTGRYRAHRRRAEDLAAFEDLFT